MSDNINPFITDYIETMSKQSETELLQSIDLSLKAICRKDGLVISQSSLKDMATVERQAERRDAQTGQYRYRNGNSSPNTSSPYNRRSSQDPWAMDPMYIKRRSKNAADRILDDLEDSFTSAFKTALFGTANPFEEVISESLRGLANKLGVSVDNLGDEVGKRLGNIAGDAFKNNKFGNRLTREWQSLNNFFSDTTSDFFNFAGDFLKDSKSMQGKGFKDIANMGMESLKKNVSNNFGDLGYDLNDVFNLFKGGNGANAGRAAAEAGESIISGGAGSSEVIDTVASIINSETGVVEVVDAIVEGGAAAEGAGGAIATLGAEAAGAGTGLMAAGGAAAEAGTGLVAAGGAAVGAAGAFPVLTVAIIAATVIIDKLSDALGPAIEGFKSFGKSISEAADRDITSRQRIAENQKARIKADSEAVTRAAFDVIEKSANRVTEVWDNVLKTVSSTQGYDKAGVQALWSNYAKTLQDEGLASVISSADIMEQLQSVLNSGLSGAVAESFAYQATLLNNAMPTEDFFQYANTYASLAANAMKNGASQEEAIELANNELRSFASNLLYASREIAGGFSSSLTGAASLFEESAKIALASHSSLADVSDISAVLTSVSGIVGAIAPDVADSLVSAIVNAATGGNASEITALRSLAGVGASNTAFLQAFAKDPKRVFTDLFSNLAQLQSMSSSNYMEVAEALSSVFGLSMDAFARVDFNYLAEAIDKMNLDSKAIEKNFDLLKSGQTTSTDEQLRMQQINKYMIEEGLAYVLDNEVARSIQQHMWDEQLANELMKNEFSVNVVGGLIDLVTGLQNTVSKILDLTPVGWIKKGMNLVLTATELVQDTFNRNVLLTSGLVGTGATLGAMKELSDLTTTGNRHMLFDANDVFVSRYVGLNSPFTTSGSKDYYSRKLVGKSVTRSDPELWKQYSHEYSLYNNIVEPVKTASVTIAKAVNTLSYEGGLSSSGGSSFKGGYLDISYKTLSQAASQTASETAAKTVTASTAKVSQQVAERTDTALKAAKKLIASSVSTAKQLTDTTTKVATSSILDQIQAQIKDTRGYLDTASLDQSTESKNAIKDITHTLLTMERIMKDIKSGNFHGTDQMQSALNALIDTSVKAKDQVKDAIQLNSGNIAKTNKDAKEAADKALEKAAKLDAAQQQKNRQQANQLSVMSAISQADAQIKASKAAFKATSKATSKAIEAGLSDPVNGATALSQALTSSLTAYTSMTHQSASAIDSLRTTIKDTEALDLLSSDKKQLEAMIEDANAAGKAGQYIGLAHRSFLTQAEIEEALANTSIESGSFADWVASVEKTDAKGARKYNLEELLSQYDASLSDLEAIYNEQEAAKTSASTKAREIHEVQFWEDMQHFATIDFPWYMREWERYYIQHEAYTTASNDAYTKATQLKAEEQGELGDSVLALARALTENDMWKEGMEEIKDPVLHTNVLLSKILLTVEAIMQQNNDTSIVSIPTALSALGLGSSNL